MAHLHRRASSSIADLGVSVVGVRFFGITRGIFRYLERLVSHNVTFRLLARLRVWFYEKLEPLAPARLMEFQRGDLLARVIGDVETLENFYVRVVSPPLTAVIVGFIAIDLPRFFLPDTCSCFPDLFPQPWFDPAAPRPNHQPQTRRTDSSPYAPTYKPNSWTASRVIADLLAFGRATERARSDRIQRQGLRQKRNNEWHA